MLIGRRSTSTGKAMRSSELRRLATLVTTEFLMNVHRRDFLFHSGLFAAALVGQTTSIATASTASADSSQLARSGRGDFDFFIGHWTVSAKRLRHRLTGDQTWETVTGTTRVMPILQGAGNVDEDEFQLPGQTYIGGMLRLFDAKQNNWSTYGLDRDSGVLQPPQSGRFLAGRGEFYGNDEDGGRPVKVRHLYMNLTPVTCRWEQAFSVGESGTWETNWVIDFTRMATRRTG